MATAISITGLSKRYRIGVRETGPETLVEAAVEMVTRPLSNYRRLRRLTAFTPASESDVVWALDNVSFDVARGQIVGVVGRNGSGKSTLLKILSRVTEPTSGRAVINGRVAA